MPSQQFMSAAGSAMIDLLLANVGSAIAGIDINVLGADLHPFAALQSWSTDLENQASTAVNNANTATLAAATANTGVNTTASGVTNSITGAAPSSSPNDVAPAVQLLNATVQASTNTPQVDVYNTAAAWNAPTGGTSLNLTLTAAGAAGAQGGMGATGAAGGGGGAGGYSTYGGIAISSLPSSCPVVVGIGGTGGENVVASYSDNFQRADNVNLGSNWRVDSGTASPQIISNVAEIGPMSVGNGENGMWATWVGGALLTDNYIVQAQLAPPTIGQATNNYTGVYVAAPTTYGSGTKLVCFAGETSGGCQIFTQTNAVASPYYANGTGTGQTVVATSATSFTETSLIALSRIGNVFTGFINGTAVATWTDTGNTVPTGSAERSWGFVVEGNYPPFQGDFSSPAISNIQARDIGVLSQPGTSGGNSSFNGSAYQVTGGTGGVGGGTDSFGVTRPSTGSWLNTSTAWNGAQGTGNQTGVNPSGGCGAAGVTGHVPGGTAGGNGLNTSGGAAGTSGSLNGQPGTSPTGGAYGPGSGAGGGYYITGSLGNAGLGAVGGFPGGAGSGGGASTDGQGSNGTGGAGADGQVVATTFF